MERLAPSAANKQPWRAVVDENRVHFYEMKSMKDSPLGDAQKVDVGIALSHFELTIEENGKERRQMKAAILNKYNKNGCDLEIRDIPIPKVADNEVLVKIRTAGVNPLDNMIVHGEVKLIVPYSFPLVMGNEFVGIIEKTDLVSLRGLPQKNRSISSFLSMKMEQDLIGSRRSSRILTLKHLWMKCSAWMMSILLWSSFFVTFVAK